MDGDPGQERDRRDLGPLWWLLLLIPAALIFPYTPVSDWILCPFRWLSGLSCPGCGMTRSVTSLVVGDLRASIHYHPGGPLLVIALGWAGAIAVADRLTGRTVWKVLRERWQGIASSVYLLMLLALLVFWAVRLYGELGF